MGISKIWNVSNYYTQSRNLHEEAKNQGKEMDPENGTVVLILRGADAFTFLRETAKLGTVIGLVSLASSVVFNFDSPISLTCTTICGISWLFTRKCAQRLENAATNIIKAFSAEDGGPINSFQRDKWAKLLKLTIKK